ncbi:MAG: 3-isopropylmalate dehydrogenase [Alphaproteobacteria bacterium]
MAFHLLVLPGDGIGPEVTAQARRVLEWFESHRGLDIEIEEGLIGGASHDRHGSFLTEETKVRARVADALLIGAEGGPKWAHIRAGSGPESRGGLIRLRRELDVYANLRPIRAFDALAGDSPLKAEVIRGVDFMIVRELTGGVYFGEPRGIEELPDGTRRAVDTQVYTTPEITRVARTAFELARARAGRLHSVEKANVMKTGVLWRQEVQRLHQAEYADVALENMLADNCAMQLVRNPRQFDVIVTDNLFGDLLSDGAAMIAGSLGMLPSASLGAPLGAPDAGGRRKAIYEPIHGSAPDIAGRGVANPLGAILSVAMMLRHSLNRGEDAELLEEAVQAALARGLRTDDIAPPGAPTIGTEAMGDGVLAALEAA